MKKNQFDDLLKQVFKKQMIGIDLKTGNQIRIGSVYCNVVDRLIKKETNKQ